MPESRRRLLAGLLGAGLLAAPRTVAATTRQAVAAQATLTGEGSAAVVPEATLDANGYVLVEQGVFELVETVETPDGETVTLRAASPAVEYRRVVDLGFVGSLDVGAFATIAIPAFEVEGAALNPIADADNRVVAGLVEERFPSLQVGEERGTATVAFLGQQAEMTTFEGAATVADTTLPVFVHVTRVRSGDDVVVAVGVHARIFPDERDRILALLAAIEHPGSPAGTATATG